MKKIFAIIFSFVLVSSTGVSTNYENPTATPKVVDPGGWGG